jgi:hypothetical protein
MELEILELIKKHQAMPGKPKGKILRKELEMKDKLKKKLYRATYAVMLIPQKFINPYKVYKLLSDHPLIEEDGKFYSAMSAFAEWKYISAININHNDGIVSAIYSNNPNFVTPPWQYVVERMRSFGNLEANEMAAAVETFCNSSEAILNKHAPLECPLPNGASLNPINPYDRFLMAKTKEHIIQNTLVWSFKYTIKNYESELNNVGYNKLLAQALEFDSLEDLGSTLKKNHCVEALFGSKEDTESFKTYLNQIHNKKENYLCVDVPSKLISRNGTLLPVMMTHYTFTSQNDKKEMEMELCISMKIVGPPDPSKQPKAKECIITPKQAKIEQQQEKQLNYFLDAYYKDKHFPETKQNSWTTTNNDKAKDSTLNETMELEENNYELNQGCNESTYSNDTHETEALSIY